MEMIFTVVSEAFHSYQVIVCFADRRRVKAFRGTLKCPRLGGHLFVCNHRDKYYESIL